MARTRHTARKSTGRLPVGQLAPQNVPQPEESQPDIPQEATPEEEPFEIELVVPESPTAQDSPAEEQQQEDPGTEDKTDEEQLPPSDWFLRSCTEMLTRWSPSELNLRSSSAGFELCWSTWASPPLPGIKSRKSRVQGEWSSRPSQRFSSDLGSSADTRDQPSGLRAAMLLSMLPGRPSHHRKKDQFKAYGVKKDIPRMEMVHHQDVAIELSTRLLTAQREIETLRAQLQKADATIRAYMRMVEGQASDLYASDTDTWTVTSSVESSGKESAVGNHSPSGSRSR
jgi:hypothetical protein